MQPLKSVAKLFSPKKNNAEIDETTALGNCRTKQKTGENFCRATNFSPEMHTTDGEQHEKPGNTF